MSTCLFDVSEEDYYSLIFKHIAELHTSKLDASETDKQKGEELLMAFGKLNRKDGDGQLVDEVLHQVVALFVENVSILFENGTDQETECCVQLMSHLLTRLDVHQSEHLTLAFITAIASNVENKGEIRLACILHLLNANCHEGHQYMILSEAIQYALKADLANTLSNVLKGKVPDLVLKWKLLPSDASQLYFGVASLMRRSKNEDEAGPQAMILTSKALSLINASDNAACKEVANEAAEAIRDFLRAKKLMTCDLLELAPVKALTKNPTYLHLHQLFSAVIKGQIDQLDTVCRPELLKNLGITQELCLEKTRMAVLLSVAKNSSYKPIPYQNFATALRIDRDEVEQWIVKAIGEGLLTARLDQIREVVSVNSCANRGFEDDDWKRLKDQLGEWKMMLVDIEETVGETMATGSLHSAPRIS